jgi:hypothetical protein
MPIGRKLEKYRLLGRKFHHTFTATSGIRPAGAAIRPVIRISKPLFCLDSRGFIGQRPPSSAGIVFGSGVY